MVDTVVVGAGSAGCAFAARVGGHVLLLEAGPASWAPELRRASSLAAIQPGHPQNWAFAAELGAGTAAVVPRGRGLGGSSAVNGANWMRPTPADGWAWDELLPHLVGSETDLDMAGPLHGTRGPIPVRRPSGALLHPAAERFAEAARRLGHAEEPDKNAGAPPGYGPVPGNVVDGVRVDAATAYLHDVPGLEIRAAATVSRIVLDGTRAIGVELTDGALVEAGEVVLAAGAIGTPHLLLRSGIGPADDLRACGIEVAVDLPAVGTGWSDHPAVFVPFADTDPPAHPDATNSQVVLHLDTGADPAGDVEVLLFVRPFVPGGDLHLMCALQQPDSRGTLSLSPTGAPVIGYHYLRTESDRRRLRHAIRTAAELLRAGLGRRTSPDGAVLGNDRTLDGWIAAHLTTQMHMCGSAALGRVVDPQLRVMGVDGLRVVDTSVLPRAPRRGTAAAAVALGEKAAALVDPGAARRQDG
ncbi:GMC family oxidoreductase N-terminal domain-containing protein [Actinomycetes bacterium KLBMP 9759]